MWFEQLGQGIEEANPGEAIKALYAIMYYYFSAICFIGLIWLLWQVIELRIAITFQLSLLVGVFGLMVLVINGLRQLKAWAKILLIVNYAGLIGGAVYGLVLTSGTLMGEVNSSGIIAACIYLLIILLCGYGFNLLFSPNARKLNWR